MRLLPKQEANQTLEAEERTAKNKLSALLSTIHEATQKLNDFMDRDQVERARLTREHAEFVQSIITKRDALVGEITTLSAERAELLKPIHLKEKELLDRETEVSIREKEARNYKLSLIGREEEMANLTELYESKLDEFGEKNQQLLDWEHKLKTREDAYKVFCEYKEMRIKQEWDRIRNLIKESKKN